MNLSRDLRHRDRFEEGDMKDIVDSGVSREIKTICHRIDLLQYWVRSQMFEVKFVRWVCSLNMTLEEPNKITNFILWGLEDLLVVEVSMIFLS